MDSFLLGVIKQCAALRFSVLRNKPNTEHNKDGKDLQRAQTFDHAACNSSLWYAAEMAAALQAEPIRTQWESVILIRESESLNSNGFPSKTPYTRKIHVPCFFKLLKCTSICFLITYPIWNTVLCKSLEPVLVSLRFISKEPDLIIS